MTSWGGITHDPNKGKTEEELKETHPNFTITCDKCGSKRVYVENSIGFSEISGAWGSVDLVCAEPGCDNQTELFEPL